MPMGGRTGIVVIAANEDMFVFAFAFANDKNGITRLRLLGSFRPRRARCFKCVFFGFRDESQLDYNI